MKKTVPNIKGAGILLLLILIVMASLLFVNNKNAVSSKDAFKSLRTLQLAGQLEAADKNSSVGSLDELLVEANGTVVKARNIQGENVWNKSFAGKITLMKSSNTGLFIIDSTKKLYC
ncbi:MAG: hypothetical protein K0R84_944, partial [Clostridia bacterium]|nr:hypothetical protein [Clostridia bacterium]